MNIENGLYPYDAPEMVVIGVVSADVLAESGELVGGSSDDYVFNDENWW